MINHIAINRPISKVAYVIVEKDYQRNKFKMSNVKNGTRNDTSPILFDKHPTAQYISEILNVSISRTSCWDDALELKNGELVATHEFKDYMAEDGVDFEYCIVKEVECLDDECLIVKYDD